MIQNSRVLTREVNPISLISAVQATTQAEYLAVAQREVLMSTIEQTWRFEVADKAPVNTMTDGQVNPFVKIANWLSHLGSRRINENYLESRQNIDYSAGIRSIRL
jgi:hypothetical protein